ncbi:MAG: D-alanine--D-alanine ligase [bacterium]
MTAPRLKVAVLMGGRSGEHDVSRESGWAVLTQLPEDAFNPIPVLLGRDGCWRFPSFAEADPGQPAPPGAGLPLPEGVRALLSRQPDVVFIAMHGPEGEDGKVQSLLELVGLPYVGSDAYASSLAMNKPVAKAVYRAHDIPVADDWLLSRRRWEVDRRGVLEELRRRFTPPWVLKTPKLGSSVGLAIVPAEGALEAELARLLTLDDVVLVEAFVTGRELTCAVLDSPTFGAARPLPILEITPVDSPFFDYHAKYTPGAAREICPAPIEEGVRDRAQALGLLSHRVLGCRDMSRTDFILTPEGKLVTLETNTIPGFTRTSLLPQQAAADGIPFAELVAGLTRGAYHRQRARA